MRLVTERSKSSVPFLTAALFAGVLAFASAPTFASAVTIQDGFVQAGVNNYGTLGSGDTTPPGILYDPTGTGSYGINDFLTPGDPFEGFYITGASGFSFGCNNDFGCYDGTSSSPTSSSATSASWMGTSTDGALTITNTYTLTTLGGQSVIAITTTLTNNTDGALSGLQFLRTLDPDPDVNAYGSYDTNNSVLSNDQACGTGSFSGETICIYSFSSLTHKAGVSGPGWSTDPSAYLAGLNAGDGDYAIGIGFLLGDLGAGQSLTFDYGYGLGASLDVASGGGTSVPEPSGLAMFGLGLLALLGFAGIDATRRARRAAV